MLVRMFIERSRVKIKSMGDLIRFQEDFEAQRKGTDGSLHDANTVGVLLMRGIEEETSELRQALDAGDLRAAQMEAVDVLIFWAGLAGKIGLGDEDLEALLFSCPTVVVDNAVLAITEGEISFEKLMSSSDVETGKVVGDEAEKNSRYMEKAGNVYGPIVAAVNAYRRGDVETVRAEAVLVLVEMLGLFKMMGLSGDEVAVKVEQKVEYNEKKYNKEYFEGRTVKEGIRVAQLMHKKHQLAGKNGSGFDEYGSK